MNQPPSPESYEAEVELCIRKLTELKQIEYVVECLKPCISTYQSFNPSDFSLENAISDVERWLKNEPMNCTFDTWDLILSNCQRLAVEAYDRTDGMLTIENASFDGIRAYKAGNCAEAVAFLISAIASPEDRSSICAEAIASAWMASLFDSSVRERQLSLVDKYKT